MSKDVYEKIEDMKSRTKGVYLTQGVSFNKNSPRQMELLKFALENSDSFSGLVKELLAKMLDDGGIHHSGGVSQSDNGYDVIKFDTKNKNVGNFL